MNSAYTLAAHRAYLQTTTDIRPANGAKIVINFGDETDGVQFVEVPSQRAAVVYNLSGQRVENPTKGIFIINGKKVIR